jgi:hypothetical protein
MATTNKKTENKAANLEETEPKVEVEKEIDELEDDNLDERIEYPILPIPIKCKNSDNLPFIHWTELETKQRYHNSLSLQDVVHDKKITSQFHNCFFVTLIKNDDNEEYGYVKVLVDKDFVLYQLATILETYANTNTQKDALITESKAISEKIRSKKIDASLADLARIHGISLDDLKNRLGR